MHHVHVIPVPRDSTPVEAWREICDRGSLNVPDPRCRWAVLRCDGDGCRNIYTAA